MANHDYNFTPREPTRVYTPSLDSDEDLPHLSTLDIAASDKSYRLFTFRKDGRSWVHALCNESSLPESEIKARAKRPRKPKHGVEQQLDKMSPPRKNAIVDLVERTKRRDPDGDDWDIVAIDNDKPELTKRTGEVVAFSVILARSASNRSTSKPISQERRRSSFISPTQDFAVPNRRGSKTYHTSPNRDRVSRQNPSFRSSQTILEDDPFGSTNLFSSDGKPIHSQSTASHPLGGLPAHIPLGDPIGAKPQKQQKDKQEKQSRKTVDEGPLDLDALLGPSLHSSDPLGDLLHDDLDHHGRHDRHGHHSSESDSPIEIEVDDHDSRQRGRKRNDSGFASRTPKRSSTSPKSKSKPRRPSVHIPKENKYAPQPIEIHPLDTKYSANIPGAFPQDKYDSRRVEVATSNRRRPQSYYGSKYGSETAPSVHSYSDQSVLEAEYEEYSSSNSSGGYEQPVDWRGGYSQSDGRYQRATRDHRRGPPSPQQARYEPDPIPYPGSATSSRRPRHERIVSEGAVTRFYPPSATSARAPILTHQSTPRFEPRSSYSRESSVYNHDTGLVPYPSDLRRRDSIKARDAEMYIQSEVDKDREIELLQRERDLARREADLHQEVARRASIHVKAKTPKYTHEPRQSRRYTDAYYP